MFKTDLIDGKIQLILHDGLFFFHNFVCVVRGILDVQEHGGLACLCPPPMGMGKNSERLGRYNSSLQNLR